MSKTGHGGARTGAGRKSKAAEEDLQRLFEKCFKKKDQEKVFAKLVADASSDSFRVRNESRKLLFAYLYGKPTQRVIVEEEPPAGGNEGIDLSQLTAEELTALERASEIITKSRRGAGRESAA